MKVGEIFDGLLENLKVDNRLSIRKRRDEIAKTLNGELRALSSSTSNQLMIGSYGRSTAIRGISDLDMLYILPPSIRSSYSGEDGPSKILNRTRNAICRRYPNTSVKVDRLVVVVQFQNFKFEVQPVFENTDKSFSYPDTRSKEWKVTKPRAEFDAIRDRDASSGGTLRDLCKMARAWKNAHGVVMGGLLIDTLAYNFFNKTKSYDKASTNSYSLLARDFFEFLSKEDDHDFYAALGSRQRVRVKKKFQRRAKHAHGLCLDAIAADGKKVANKKWKAVFGKPVPNAETAATAAVGESYTGNRTEQFIEDYYPVDIRNFLSVDCKVTQDGFRPAWLRSMIASRTLLRVQKDLDFKIESTDVREPYDVRWKVLNQGSEAERRDQIRGQIIRSNRSKESRHERTSFQGEHYVECYLIKDGVVVARDRINVPISS